MKNLLKALAEFQQEVPVIHKGTQGYGYSYANLATIFEVINPILKKNKLGFTQLVGDNNIKTIVFHYESGEQLETTTTIPQGTNLKGMNDFQTLGSAITYIRRYALSSALGLITDKDTDAGGEQEGKKETPKTSPSTSATELPPLSDKAFKAMLEAIEKGEKDKVKAAMTKYTLLKPQLDELTKLLN